MYPFCFIWDMLQIYPAAHLGPKKVGQSESAGLPVMGHAVYKHSYWWQVAMEK